MPSFLSELLRGGTQLAAARRQGKRERSEYERQAMMDILQRRLMEAQIGGAQAQGAAARALAAQRAQPAGEQWTYHFDPETGSEVRFNAGTGERQIIPSGRGKRAPTAPPRQPLVTSPEGVRVPDEPGTQVAPPGGMGSAAVLNAIKENQTKLSVIDNALMQLETRPQGVGLKGIIPDIALQRIDPEGVDLRANVADIGSMVIHDRSGAAVTAREMPRLSPFIPKASDTPDTVRRKLARMKAIINEETAFLDRNRQRTPIGAIQRQVYEAGPRPASTGIPDRFRP